MNFTIHIHPVLDLRPKENCKSSENKLGANIFLYTVLAGYILINFW